MRKDFLMFANRSHEQPPATLDEEALYQQHTRMTQNLIDLAGMGRGMVEHSNTAVGSIVVSRNVCKSNQSLAPFHPDKHVVIPAGTAYFSIHLIPFGEAIYPASFSKQVESILLVLSDSKRLIITMEQLSVQYPDTHIIAGTTTPNLTTIAKQLGFMVSRPYDHFTAPLPFLQPFPVTSIDIYSENIPRVMAAIMFQADQQLPKAVALARKKNITLQSARLHAMGIKGR